MTKVNSIWIILTVVLLVLLVWGVIGGNEAQDAGNTCDFGIGKVLCWKWHQNPVGDAGEFLDDVFDS